MDSRCFLLLAAIAAAVSVSSCKKPSGAPPEASAIEDQAESGAETKAKAEEKPVAEKNATSQEKPDASAKSAPSVSEEDFFQAALDGDIEKVRKALAGGMKAGLVGKQDGRTALMLASFNGHTEIVRLLVDAGADVNARDLLDRTALMYAATGPFVEAVRYLLDHGAKVNIVDNKEHWTPLMFAAAEGQTGVVQMLLDAGADPLAVDVDGEDSELFARHKGHPETADLIKAAKEKAKRAKEKQK